VYNSFVQNTGLPMVIKSIWNGTFLAGTDSNLFSIYRNMIGLLNFGLNKFTALLYYSTKIARILSAEFPVCSS
jgi:hypothetical protein